MVKRGKGGREGGMLFLRETFLTEKPVLKKSSRKICDVNCKKPSGVPW